MTHLPESLRSLMAGYRRRLNHRLLLESLAQGGAVFLLLLLIFANAERFVFGSAEPWRWVLFVLLWASAVTAFTWWRIRGQKKLADPVRLAHRLEQSLGSSEEQFASGMQLFEPGQRERYDPGMASRLESGIDDLAENAALHLPPPKPLQKFSAVCGGLLLCQLLLMLIPGYQYGLMTARVLVPWVDLARPAFTQIQVGELPSILPRGEDLSVPVQVSGRIPERAFVEWSRSPDTAPAESATLQRTARDSFLHFFLAVPESFSFRIVAGDNQTEWFEVQVADRPEVAMVAVDAVYLDYTGLPAATNEGEGAFDVRLPVGSKAVLRFEPRHPVRSAKVRILQDQKESVLEPDPDEDGGYSLAFEDLQSSFSWVIELESEEGFVNLDRDTGRLQVSPDGRPSLRLMSTDNYLRVYPSENIPLTVEAEDDFGLTEIDFAYRRNPDPDHPRSPKRSDVWRPEADSAVVASVQTEVEVRPSDFEAVPGDVVELFVEGLDTLNQFGSSQPIYLEVVAFDPGREERNRIRFLRFLQMYLESLETLPKEKQLAGGWVLGSETEEYLSEQAASLDLGDLVWDGARGSPVLKRLGDEIRATHYPLYRQDLHVLLQSLGLLEILGPEAARENPGELLRFWREQYLVSAIHFRSVLNLAGVLEELNKALISRAAQGEDSGLEDFRETANDWFAEAGRIYSDAGILAPQGESWDDLLRALGTRLYSLRFSRPATVEALAEEIQVWQQAAADQLPLLAENFASSRGELSLKGNWLFDSLDPDFLQQYPTELRVWIQRNLASLEDDSSASPVNEVFWQVLAEALRLPDPYGRFLAAANRLRTSEAPAIVQNRQAWLNFGLRSYYLFRATGQGGGISPEALQNEQQLLGILEESENLSPAQAMQLPEFSFEDLPSFAGEPSTALDERLDEVAAAAVAWQEKLKEIETTLTNFVPSSTIKMRAELMAAEQASLESLERLNSYLRFVLRLGWSPPSDYRLNHAELTTLSIALGFRQSTFLQIADEPRIIFLTFADKELSATEMDLFSTRINSYRGATVALIRLLVSLQSDEQELAREALKAEAGRIALASRLHKLLAMIQAEEPGDEWPEDWELRAAAANEILSTRTETAGEDQETLWEQAVRTLERQNPASIGSEESFDQKAVLFAKNSLFRSSLNWEAAATTAQEPATRSLLQQAYFSLLAPAASSDPGTMFRGGQGTDVERQRLWIVDELREMQSLGSPGRFSETSKQYLDLLRRSFRQYPHTR